jgi:hypothetical protein
MADNSSLPVASGNETFANDDIGGVKYPRAKMTWGPDGTANDTDVASGKPLPVQNRHSDGTILSDATGLLISTSQLDPVVAHDAADSGAPYKQGFKATTSISAKTMVANDDRTDGFAGIDGVQIVRPHCNLEDIVTGNATCTAGASTTIVASQGAGLKFYMTDVLISNDGSTGGRCAISDGSRTITVPFSADGAVKGFNNPVPFAAATAVTADPTGSDDIIVTLIGFKSKV